VERIFLHTWRTGELLPTSVEDWYGVADPNTGAPHPTASAYANVLQSSVDRAPGAVLPLCDDQPPKVEIEKVVSERGKVTIRFSADEQAKFRCKLGKRKWRKCRSPVRYPATTGSQVFRVEARDAAGNASTKRKKIRARR
jgi:hypothetical protein